MKWIQKPWPSALCPEALGVSPPPRYLQLSSGHFVVDELLVPALLLGDGDVGQRCLKVQDLLHLGPDGVFVPAT